jgi:NAD(P)-dependent dehydrogenase (short-subunit alcohol dehydrogenase family)
MSWSGATAVVTGAGSGIGKALACAMASRGANVFVTDVNEQSAREVAATCGARAQARRLDVRDPDAVRAVIEEAATVTGRLDYLFNNAGIALGGEAQDLVLGHWERILDVNVRGVVHGVVAAYPMMVKQGRGHIVNVASLAGLGAAPLLAPYSMTKHAVVGLSTSLRAEGAALGVRVSVLCPAAIETPILDSENPKDLPNPTWKPDMRRFLTKIAGPPYPVDELAKDALAGVEKNQAVIVVPGRARLVWRVSRWFPALAELGVLDAVASERKHKS